MVNLYVKIIRFSLIYGKFSHFISTQKVLKSVKYITNHNNGLS